MNTARPLSYCISSVPYLDLVAYPVPGASAASASPPLANTPMDIVAAVDVSGSMRDDLPDFRRELGNMLPRFLLPGDTFTLIYFSGPNQCGVLLDRVQIRAGGDRLTDISNIQRTLATLETIGMTCFTDPLVLAGRCGARLAHDNPDGRRTLIFATDGYDNMSTGGRAAILAQFKDTAKWFSRVVTMGVGWYCDQGFCQDMAASVGGEFHFARDIGSFNRDFESAAAKRPRHSQRTVTVKLTGLPVEQLAFTIGGDGTITQYIAPVASNEVTVPEGTEAVWYLSSSLASKAEDVLSDVGKRVAKCKHVNRAVPDSTVIEAAYAALALFAQRSRRLTVRALAGAIGDVRLHRMAVGAFGPQRYADLTEAAAAALTGEGRFKDGFAVPSPPDPNAYTVIDALQALASGKNAIVPDDPRFKYTPITRGRLNASNVVTATEAKAIEEQVGGISHKLATIFSTPALSVVAGDHVSRLDDALRCIEGAHRVLFDAGSAIDKIKASKKPAATYTYDLAPKGYLVDGLPTSSEEANVSIRIKRPITVDLTEARATLAEGLRERVPTNIASYRYQSFTVITGRVLNLSVVTAILDAKTWAEYARAGLVKGAYRAGEIVAVDFSSLPIINDSMTEKLSAKETVGTALRLECVKGALKVWKDVVNTYAPEETPDVVTDWILSAGISTSHDVTDVTRWLEGVGVTDNGFAPSSTAAPATDKRRSWLLDVAIPGLSSLPSVAKVREKLAKIAAWQKTTKGREPKLTASERLIANPLAELDAWCKANKIDLAKLDPQKVAQDNARAKEMDAKHMARKFWPHDKLVPHAEQQIEALNAERKQLLIDLNRAATIAICGGEWFSDLKPGENTVEAKLGDETLTCTVGVKDVDIDV